jgi:DNA helicase-2/ATP-dependent DNA helicase PcrA
VILDEHQDASPAQHDAVMSMTVVAQLKVRAFGDPMQAIYGDEDEPAVDWNVVEHGANQVAELDEPQRWPHAKELGYWVLAARNRLRSGHTLPQRSRTTPVTIHSLDAADQGFRSANSPVLSGLLHDLLDECEGSVVVLGRYNQQVLQLQVLGSGRLTLNEGVEFEDAHGILAKLEKATGKPAALARVIIASFDRPCCGMTQHRSKGITKCLGKRELAESNRKELKTFVEQLRPVYVQPTLSTACAVINDIAQNPPDWLTIRHRQCFRILGSLRPEEGYSPKDALREAILRHKRTARKRLRCASTIHKSKGMEFDHVILANFGATHFSDDEACRRLAYVALSRACKSIHVIVPAKTPSPLL